ncbi:NrdH-redoxin [Vibrio sp. UCD-FRSSP16_10]|uniref:glutaredoxin family protein n=1 Tax=unclassified Vibrio TaxID=2614977 RepID=UPI0007FDB129|nr:MULTISPECIES: glutaredoxin family protein [unclassified Vibrio]OBT12198.1 NrdH-redoxin [Vibrio sp. UCD-FRSSP16_30]OBT20530.1 NrdH-redoxin [Vibrio sp. UCD-FRSSP16_10]
MSVTLYSTQGCHLCEQAFALLAQLAIEPQVIDIAFDDDLFLRYGVTIPVVQVGDVELNWPFNLQQLQLWLDNNGITYHS